MLGSGFWGSGFIASCDYFLCFGKSKLVPEVFYFVAAKNITNFTPKAVPKGG